MESTGELGWFRAVVLRSIVSPRTFARELGREHFGLAGVLVALVAGMGLSLTIDVFVLAAKGIPPTTFVSRLVVDAFLLGVRLTITAAVLASIVYVVLSLLRRDEATIDQAFTAIAFALSPLILTPIAAIFPVIAGELTAVGSALFVFIAGRALAGLALNLRAILPLPLAVIAMVVLLVSGSFVLSDQVARVRMTAYAVAPRLAPALEAPRAQGTRYDIEGTAITVPAEWSFSRRGVAGEVAHFETATATLNVVRGRPEPFATLDRFADDLARSERLGYTARLNTREVVRVNDVLAIDDRADGTYEGRHIALRQFTVEAGASGFALQFRFFDPADVAAAFAEAASIAATLTVAPLP